MLTFTTILVISHTLPANSLFCPPPRPSVGFAFRISMRKGSFQEASPKTSNPNKHRTHMMRVAEPHSATSHSSAASNKRQTLLEETPQMLYYKITCPHINMTIDGNSQTPHTFEYNLFQEYILQKHVEHKN